jgi:hypothetical protein
VHNGIAKAFSWWHLDRHEIVNDDFAGAPRGSCGAPPTSFSALSMHGDWRKT